MAKISVFSIFFFLPLLVLSDRTLDTFTIFPISGPESYAFELTGQGPYTGISDGRIIKYEGPQIGFVNFAYTSPNRTKEKCDGTNDLDLGPTCGRPLGLGFNYKTEELYIVDAFLGLFKVGPEGGLAEQLATAAEGVPFKWLDGLDVDSRTGIVYFTDISTKYTMREKKEIIRIRDSTGRFMSYDPKTKEVKVLVRGLQGPGGAAVSRDSSFVLVPEYIGGRLSKHWLKGPKAHKTELILSIPGPTNVKRTLSNDFWIASTLNLQEPAPLAISKGVKIDEFGNIIQTLNLAGIYNNSAINEVQEFDNSYYIGSVSLPFGATAPIC
ncbi:hypothetical protein ACH5RR_025061 [Cinchona calisaya]|uniref:Strictosidine synthase conserved region domain-containing protein n=1 Tax=Cinchona calisaya TaxID=153742 RepID=A0ABD2YZL9_9GENT